VGDDAGNVYAVNAESRAPIWPIKQEGREDGVFGAAGGIRGDVRADEYGVYVASTDTKLYCLNRTDGRIRWQYFAGQPLQHSPAVTATSVYEYVGGQGLIAIDKMQGEAVRKAKWTVANAIQFLAEDEKHAYLERNDHAIIAVDKATGSPKFESQRKDLVAFATSIKNNVIYATTKDGQVRAIVPVFNAGTIGEIVMTPIGAADSVAVAR
jgi:outer membrane protein assembly factor BamB